MAIERVYEDRCIGCDECFVVCPTDVFRMKENEQGERVAVIAFEQDCQTCFLCEEYCPTDALFVDPDHPRPAPSAYEPATNGAESAIWTVTQ